MKCEYGECKKEATMEVMSMDLDFNVTMLKICDKCVKQFSKGKCVIDGRDDYNKIFNKKK
tara:strand:+ start:530 stop:709 length:180 start_codon:yes stop_codon:yes gene_type:complete